MVIQNFFKIHIHTHTHTRARAHARNTHTHAYMYRGFGVVNYCGSDEPWGPDLYL